MTDTDKETKSDPVEVMARMEAMLSNCRDAIASLDESDLGWGEPGDGSAYPIRDAFLANIDATLIEARSALQAAEAAGLVMVERATLDRSCHARRTWWRTDVKPRKEPDHAGSE